MTDGPLPIVRQGAPLPMQAQPGALRTDPSAQPGAMRTGASAQPEVNNAALRRAAQEFESMFLSEMLAPMFESLDTDGLGGGGMGERIFRPMLVERYAEAIAKAGGVGLADSIIGELTRLQAGPEELNGESDGADR